MKRSAGILVYRVAAGELQVLLVHPGGPFWAARDAGAWSIPKGEFHDGEEPLQAAIREFREETGHEISGAFVLLSPREQKGGKVVHAWAVEGDLDAAKIQSNTFEINGKQYPEIDRAAWFSLAEAREKINPAQAGFLAELSRMLSGD